MFAALTYVAATSSRGGSGSTEREKFQIYVGQVTQYPITLRAAVLRIAVDGAGANNISFDFPTWGHNNYEHPAPQPDRNKVFYQEGGGVPFQRPETDKWLDSSFAGQPEYGKWMFTGSTCVPGLGTGDTAACAGVAAEHELMAILPYISLGFCKAINMKLGVNTGAQGTPPVDTGSAWTGTPEFDGTYEAPGEAISDAGGLLYRVDSGCFESSGPTPPAGSYHFFTALMQR